MNRDKIREIVDQVVTQEAGGIPQSEHERHFRCRIRRGCAEVFCIGRWRPVVNARKTPLSRELFALAKKTLVLNGALRKEDKLTFIYE